MKFTKLLFTLLTLTIYTATYAGTDPNTSTVREEIQLMIKNVDLGTITAEKIIVNFMINSDNKIIVVSTNHQSSESIIRSSLNLKSVKSTDLELNRLYTIPIQVKKM
jgi:hypothetical protein